MSKVTGVFEQLEDLDQIPIDDITKSLGSQPPHLVENLLANRILYPQVAPMKKEDLNIELAILREVIRHNPNKYFKIAEKKIIIPPQFISRFPDLNKLVLVFIDSLNPKGIVHIMQGEREILGSFVKIEFNQDKDNFEMKVLEKKYFFNRGSLEVVPCSHHCHISFKSEAGRIDGKSEATLEILGGRLGLVVDSRGVEK